MSKHPAEVIKRPLLTEKGTTMGEEDNKVLFEVAIDANKIDIRAAVEKLYEVTVLSVHTQVVRGKTKRVGRNTGKRRNWKRAIVKLDEESSIDFFGAAAS
ncbi:MAG: 50S ribosomal protein L23 [Proteobacteria bacterium]|nr:MAG: 50S ribosomal protein L23 [Pseudomonadota bacterium]PIE17861.1 MAG: 50S ribosomal protein L23 [Pseudomonadota bacterium]